MPTSSPDDIFYASYGAGRTRAQFNKDWAAFTSGLNQARQSSSNPNAVNQYLGRVSRLK